MSKPAPIAPMEALLVEALPDEGGWQFEPKWDGFRCIAVRDGADVALWSKAGKPLGRYFPEIAEMMARVPRKRFTIDGELLIELGDAISFDALQARLHPAASRVARLAQETPAQFMAFDCLSIDGELLFDHPLSRRRETLEKLVAEAALPGLRLSPRTLDRSVALDWLARTGGALDGVIAKRADDPYRPGKRAMLKVKVRRTADCVVGGFRYEARGKGVASLLLGLYDDAGLLDHVGFTSNIPASERGEWAKQLEAIAGPPGFTGKAPGGPSRWTSARSTEWQPVKPDIVVEVVYDQVSGRRFRHGTSLVRRRPDKAPKQCTFDQLRPPLTPSELAELTGVGTH